MKWYILFGIAFTLFFATSLGLAYTQNVTAIIGFGVGVFAGAIVSMAALSSMNQLMQDARQYALSTQPETSFMEGFDSWLSQRQSENASRIGDHTAAPTEAMA